MSRPTRLKNCASCNDPFEGVPGRDYCSPCHTAFWTRWKANRNPARTSARETWIHRTADRVINEIAADVTRHSVRGDLGRADGLLNATTFADLHDFVDANEYGGLCEDGTEAVWVREVGGGVSHDDWLHDTGRMQDLVDTRIREAGSFRDLISGTSSLTSMQYMPPNCAAFAIFVGQGHLADSCVDYPGTDDEHRDETWTIRNSDGEWVDVHAGQWVIRDGDGFRVSDENPKTTNRPVET